MNRFAWISIVIISIGLVIGNLVGTVQFSWVEVLGFVTGMMTVWLAVRNSPTNWPIGIISCAAYLVVFFIGKLYANSFLQFLFIVISLWGWYQWLRGGENATPRPITHLSLRLGIFLAVITPICTYIATVFLVAVDGAAPFWDTLTTVLSLVATFVMGRRHIECWFVWMGTDAIYIVLFASRGLVLTSVLYTIFLLMCFRGLWEWQRDFKRYGGVIHDTRTSDREVLSIP
jgi:nicotinamide mononucleotide transporter